jgi:putative transcriptional regulator
MERVSIRALRIDRGMTQAELAKALNVTKKTVGSWEQGKTCPRLDKIEAICEVLGASYDSIRWNV